MRSNVKQPNRCRGIKVQMAGHDVRMSKPAEESERAGGREEPNQRDTIAIIKAADEVTAGDMVRL